MPTANIDFTEELNTYNWTRATWTSDKLIAASPFRHEVRPSFFVNLETGGWHDSGAVDDEWQSGNFAKLLGYLRGTNTAEARQYLSDKYGYETEPPVDTYAAPTIEPLKLSEPERYRPLDPAMLDDYRYRHPYLARRGIGESVQRLMNIGYCKRSKAVTIPWFNTDGTLGNVMYRSVGGKIFWYARGGRPIREMVYGLNIAYERRITRAVIVEAPIDAMSVMESGTLGIAIGGTAFSRAKRDLIIRSPINEITVLRDNDAAGRLLQRSIIKALAPHMDVRVAVIPSRYGKDANDCLVGDKSKLISSIKRGRKIKQKLFL